MYEVLLACGKPDLSGELNFGTVRDAWIMQQTGYSESSVYRARKELVAAGLIVVAASGQGRAITTYTLVLEAIGVEVEMFEARAEKLRAEVNGRPVEGSPAALSQVGSETALRGQPDDSEPSKTAPPTRAHPEFSPSASPQPLAGSGQGQGDEAPLRGSEEHMASGSAAAASPCPRAASRGEPCASCRACGTNPRALRERAAAERATRRVPDILASGTPPALRDAVYARGLAEARAALAARSAPQAALTEEPQPPPVASSPPGGAP
jgi:hypothetical protein